MPRPYIMWVSENEYIRELTSMVNEMAAELEAARHILRKGTGQGRDMEALRISSLLSRLDHSLLRSKTKTKPARDVCPSAHHDMACNGL